MKKKWGNYKVLAQGKNWKLKILTLKPHSKTSLQRHILRSEFWVMLNDFAFRFIYRGQIHQLINNSDEPMKVLELQFGLKCIEKDITRYKE